MEREKSHQTKDYHIKQSIKVVTLKEAYQIILIEMNYFMTRPTGLLCIHSLTKYTTTE